MKTFFKVLLIIVAIPVLAFSAWFCYSSYEISHFEHPQLQTSFEDYPENVRYAHEVMQTFALELENEHQFFLNGFNVEKEDEKIEVLNFHVTAPYSPSLEEARALELELTQRLIEMVNNNVKIRPFLKKYPVTNQSVSIDLGFNGNNTVSFDSHVSSIHTVPNSHVPENRNRIFYRGETDPFGREFKFSETFNEARNSISPQINPFVHCPTDPEVAIELIGTSFADNLRKRLKLFQKSIMFKQDKEEFCCEFTCYSPTDQNHARYLLVSSIKKLLDEMNQQELTQIKNHPFSTNQIKLKICFRKDKAFVGRVSFDHGIDTVMFENDEITYYIIENHQVIKEPYSEAVLIAENYKPSVLDQTFKDIKSLASGLYGSLQELCMAFMFFIFSLFE